MSKGFFVGMILGLIVGGFTSIVCFRNLHEKEGDAVGDFQVINLSPNAAFEALRINKRSGETWGLTDKGIWTRMEVSNDVLDRNGIQDPDDWLRKQGYAPDSTGKWAPTNRINSN
jgi:hypothetical protein